MGFATRRRWTAAFMTAGMWLLAKGVRGRWMFVPFVGGASRLWFGFGGADLMFVVGYNWRESERKWELRKEGRGGCRIVGAVGNRLYRKNERSLRLEYGIMVSMTFFFERERCMTSPLSPTSQERERGVMGFIFICCMHTHTDKQ